MTNSQSAIALWVGRYNAEVALLVAQQAATTAEHNARYVNGLGTGVLWIDKDATDLAALAASQAALTAETTLYNTAEAARIVAVALAAANVPAAADSIAGTVNNVNYSQSPTTMMTVTVDRSGYWVAAATATCVSPAGPSTLDLLFAGSVAASTTIQGSGSGGVFWLTPVLMTAGQTITTRATMTPAQPNQFSPQALRACFVPTPAFPH